MTAADTRVGDADVSGRSNEGCDNPPLVWGYPPLLGRRVVNPFGNSQGKASRKSGTVLGGTRRGRIRGFPGRRGFRTENPAGAEELAGAEEFAGAEYISGAVAIASVGINI